MRIELLSVEKKEITFVDFVVDPDLPADSLVTGESFCFIFLGSVVHADKTK